MEAWDNDRQKSSLMTSHENFIKLIPDACKKCVLVKNK